MLVAIAASVLVSSGCRAQSRSSDLPATPDYVFKPKQIVPSPDGRTYIGHFLFVNNSKTAVKVSGFDEPDNAKFIPRFVVYEELVAGTWKPLPIGYCGTGAQDFAMEPGKQYEFVIYLTDYPEQDTPLTARVGVSGFYSEPFTLDWKKDRTDGAFGASKKEHYEKVRGAFIKAGFKPDLVADDDFCVRLLRSIMAATQTGEMYGFDAFEGKLNVTPTVLLTGNIRMDFASDKVQNHEQQYRGWFVLNPDKFSPQWFRESARKHVKVAKWGEGIQMTLTDGSRFWTPDVSLYLNIIYLPFAPQGTDGGQTTGKVPALDDAGKMFMKMLDQLDGWLRE